MRSTNARVATANGAPDLSIRDFVAPLFRRKRLLTITFISVFVVVLLLLIVMGPSYSSHMEILVNRERIDPLVSTEQTTQLLTTDNPVSPEEINSEVELLTSRDVLEKVVIANHLEQPTGFSLVDLLMPHQTQEDRIARSVKHLAKKLKIANVKSSNIIEVSYSSPNPQAAYGVLKTLGDAYMQKHVEVHRPAGSYQFFADQTQKYHDALETAETKLRNLSLNSGIADPDDQRANLAVQFAATVGMQNQAEQWIASDENRIKDDRRQMATTPQRAATLQSAASNDKQVSDAHQALLAAQNRRSQLVLKYDPSYPLVKEVDQEIAEDEAAVAQAQEKKYVSETTDRDPTYELLREDLAKNEADLAGQRAAMAAARQSAKNIQAQMVGLDQASISQQDAQREVKAAETNYLLYLGKREQERTSNALDVTRIGNVAIAVPPAIPVLPVLSWPMITLIALLAAALLSIGTAYTADYLDPSFHTPAEVIDILGIPVVVTVSKKMA